MIDKEWIAKAQQQGIFPTKSASQAWIDFQNLPRQERIEKIKNMMQYENIRRKERQ